MGMHEYDTPGCVRGLPGNGGTTVFTDHGNRLTYPWAMTSITAMSSAPQIATNAIKRSVQNAARDASVVANSPDVTSRDTIEALIDARQQVLYVKAAAKIITASDAMTQSLIDTRA